MHVKRFEWRWIKRYFTILSTMTVASVKFSIFRRTRIFFSLFLPFPSLPFLLSMHIARARSHFADRRTLFRRSSSRYICFVCACVYRNRLLFRERFGDVNYCWRTCYKIEKPKPKTLQYFSSRISCERKSDSKSRTEIRVTYIGTYIYVDVCLCVYILI